MKFKRSIIAFLLIVSVLICIAGVAADDMDESMSISENAEQIDETNEESLVIEENNEEVINTIEDDDNYDLESEELAATDDNYDLESEELASTNQKSKNLLSGSFTTVNVNMYKQTGTDYYDKTIYLKITNTETGAPVDLKNPSVALKLNNHLPNAELQNKGNGIYTLLWSSIYDATTGTYKLGFECFLDDFDEPLTDIDVVSSNTLKVTVKKAKATIKAKKLTTKYKSSKAFQIKAIYKNKKPVQETWIRLKIYTGGKYKTVDLLTNKKGIATYKKASKLSVGKHKIKISLNTNYEYAKSITSYIIVKKSLSKTKKTTSKSKKTTSKKNKTTSKKKKNKKGKSSKSSSTEKITTKIECTGSVTQKIRYRTVMNYGGGSSLATVYLDRYPYVDITPTLKGKNGKKIAGQYTATITYSDGSQDTFEGQFGSQRIYEGATGYGPYTLVIKYNGDSKHTASTYTMNGG